jgi:DNA ligase (NAD+)
MSNKGKTEKNKNIKSGYCIFPFIYKGKTYNECLDKPYGTICATKVNSKTGVMTKYGYCEKYGFSSPPRLKKGTVKKALNTKTPSPVKVKTPSPVKVKTPSPVKVKKTTIKRKKLIILSNLKPKTVKIKTPSPMKVKTPSPPIKVKTPSPIKTKAKKTIKKKLSNNLKQTSVEPIMQAQAQQVQQVPTTMPNKKRWNESFIKVLEELADITLRQGEPFKAKAYQKAQETVMTYEGDIYSVDQIKDLPGIGKTITSKLEEYVQTGTLRFLERERANPINLLTKVYGIGPKKASELIKEGIVTIADLRAHPELLNEVQRIGLKYFEAIETRIPRGEIDQYKTLLLNIFQEITPPGSTMEIVGSYRRGAQNSGDIDIIITNKENDISVLKTFMDRLIRDKIVIEVLSRGKTKSLTIARLPGTGIGTGDESVPRRVDFLYTSPSEYAFALLYFTGSKIFNTIQRARALKLGYSLNEHGLYHMEKGAKEKGAKVTGEFPDEKSIFAFLEMVYKEPSERVDGRGVSPLKPPSDVDLEMEPMQLPVLSEQAPAPSIAAKRKTLKNKKTVIVIASQMHLQAFKKQGVSALKDLTEEELSQIIRDANTGYYCNQKPIMTDNEYDVLREYILEKFPNNVAAQEGHTVCSLPAAAKNKVTLPYEMWSMDKIKPDTDALDKWKQTYKGPYVISCKLDGVSGLYSTEGGKAKLYTRGNGTIGQDISHFLPYMNLPKTPNITVRGEFIIQKDLFKTKYAAEFANSRNFVAGVINQKKPDPLKCADLSFVTYEVLAPSLKPSDQMKYLETNGFNTVQYMMNSIVTNELLSEMLIKWRFEYIYEIDGIICINDAIYPRITGNPAHAFAFKMVLSDQIAEAKVVDVIWTPSKDGYLKPRVQIEPINLGGVKIEFATGFNAKFIEENKIGVGALIRLTRSGDVIPHIIAVIQPAEQPQMPTIPYEWNSTHVDIMLMNKADDLTVKEKNITAFFSSLEVDGLGAGNVKKIIAAGFDSVPKIIAMTEADFLKVQGFKQKMAQKVKESIFVKVYQATLPELMHATNLFGRGFGTKKIQLILLKEPTILTDTSLSDEEKIKRITAVEGLAKKTAEQFVNQIPAFLTFLTEANLTTKLQEPLSKPLINEVKDTSHPLYGKQYIMTGFRDKELIEILTQLGAEQGSGVRKNTFVVLVKESGEENSKTKEAKTLGIPVMAVAEFKTKYNL